MGTFKHVERGIFKGVEWMRSHGSNSRGLVLAPPLIGGHALQQLRLLRPLVRRNLDLLSFSYAGHGGSAGTFSLQAALDNSVAVLDFALTSSRHEGRPVFGIASCFAAMPLLHAAREHGEPLEKMVLINALPNLRWEGIVFDFFRYWRSSPRWRPTMEGFKEAIQSYRDELLPNVAHGRQAFGILSRHRIKWSRTMRDLITLRRFSSKPLNCTPVLCVYGEHDRLLRQIGFDQWSGYEAMIERICPQTQFWRIDSDHFLTGASLRKRLMAGVLRFFSSNGPILANGR